MNTTTDTPENNDTPQPSRPFGFWLTAVDRLMAEDFAAAFESEGARRRDWRLLSAVDGTARHDRPLSRRKLQHLIDRGWVTADGDDWTLTDEGRAAKERLSTLVDGIRAKVADAVTAEDMATTLASLESIARAFGWDEETPLPRKRRGHGRRFGHEAGRADGFGHGRRFGHGREFGHGHGHGREFGHGHEHGREFDHGHEHGREFSHGIGDADGAHGRIDRDGCVRGHGPEAPRMHGHRGHRGAARLAQRAFERGFDAGFHRGRAA
ncbi:hypothetical protein [Microbacterium sp. p3-SID336]|uniref:hypothetical protein n=1 Tax=Microbacterium sp. p3-SID336 TaxID=2916212 RepID=UPI0021A85549|nr:hypothetical protein [Microbacterium sp. p3-SID336]MCT1479334.1 hypothetical protein [Microbacterium sp. p3-SID336]